jgi:hypothetical protein
MGAPGDSAVWYDDSTVRPQLSVDFIFFIDININSEFNVTIEVYPTPH